MSRGPEEGPRLQPGQLVELAIEKGVYRGRGLARHAGRVVLVPRAHAGDRVRARVGEVHAGWAEAALVELIEAGPGRRAAPCPYAADCGGCAYQDLGYEEQLSLKRSVLQESLRRAGVPLASEPAVVASPELGWRMRARLHFALEAGRLRLGLRREGSRRVVDVEQCLQLSRSMNAAARALVIALGPRAGSARRLRGLELLESPQGSGLVAVLETTLAASEATALATLGGRLPGLSGFGVAAGRKLVWLHGSPHVDATLLGMTLRAHVRSFFQANRFLFEPLVREVTRLVPEGPGRILDLYAGVGLFTLPLARRAAGEVLAVEAGREAAEDARANLRGAGLRGARVVEQDVAAALAEIPCQAGERVVLDPPRTGAGERVVDRIAERRPLAVVYVSCDPATLGRDLARFAGHGYRVEHATLFDMFPDTFHLETVVRLRRGGEAQPASTL